MSWPKAFDAWDAHEMDEAQALLEAEPDCDHRHQTDTAPFDEPYPVWICSDCGSRCEP